MKDKGENMKKYKKPVLNIVEFDNLDVIMDSNPPSNQDDVENDGGLQTNEILKDTDSYSTVDSNSSSEPNETSESGETNQDLERSAPLEDENLVPAETGQDTVESNIQLESSPDYGES